MLSFNAIRITTERTLILFITHTIPAINCGTCFCVERNKRKFQNSKMAVLQNDEKFTIAKD